MYAVLPTTVRPFAVKLAFPYEKRPLCDATDVFATVAVVLVKVLLLPAKLT